MNSNSTTRPNRILVVDDDARIRDLLRRYLTQEGFEVLLAEDGKALNKQLTRETVDLMVLDLMLPGVAGTELLRIIRKRSQAGVLIVSGRLGPEVFAEVINAGADMYLTKPVTFEQVELAVRAVHRRIMTTARTATAWKLDSRRSLLTAPDGQSVELGATDLILMECFLQAQGETVSRDHIRSLLTHTSAAESDNNLHATIYRLRRRIEKATPVAVPLQSQQKVGYQFRAPLIAA